MCKDEGKGIDIMENGEKSEILVPTEWPLPTEIPFHPYPIPHSFINYRLPKNLFQLIPL